MRGDVGERANLGEEKEDVDVCFVEPAPPKYSFNLADALRPLSSFFFLVCSSWIEPRVDELHLDLRTRSSLVLVWSRKDTGDGEGENEKDETEGVYRSCADEGEDRVSFSFEGRVSSAAAAAGGSCTAASSLSLSKLMAMSASRSKGVTGIDKGSLN
jgi:hypothetical protein